ncbi:MAG: hypothetical protein KC766_32345 [Myxococcales bacterium]|nr:hypothetical protein [Myxococcales bacterium]
MGKQRCERGGERALARSRWPRLLLAGLLGGTWLVACGDHDAAECTSYDCDSIENLGGSGGGGGTGTSAGPGYPCDVYAVVQAKCLRCHGDPTENGAPFSLATWQDTQADYLGNPRWQAMQNAVETDFMPATFFNDSKTPLDPPVEGLTTAEKQTLLDWFDGGARSSEPGCEF